MENKNIFRGWRMEDEDLEGHKFKVDVCYKEFQFKNYKLAF